MEETVTNSKPKRFYLYSAHDITIINTMRTMGFTSDLFLPDYGAMFILEVHRANNRDDPEVKVVFVRVSLFYLLVIFIINTYVKIYVCIYSLHMSSILLLQALYLNSSETKIAYPLTIPNCVSPCLLQNLKETLHKVIPDDWDAECKI